MVYFLSGSGVLDRFVLWVSILLEIIHGLWLGVWGCAEDEEQIDRAIFVMTMQALSVPNIISVPSLKESCHLAVTVME